VGQKLRQNVQKNEEYKRAKKGAMIGITIEQKRNILVGRFIVVDSED